MRRWAGGPTCCADHVSTASHTYEGWSVGSWHCQGTAAALIVYEYLQCFTAIQTHMQEPIGRWPGAGPGRAPSSSLG